MMRGLLVILCFLQLSLRGQPGSVGEISFSLSDTVQGPYRPRKAPHLYIASKFGSPVVEKSRKLDSVSGFLIEEIVLVFSQYRQSDNFSQMRLNNDRWQNLLVQYPSLFQSGTTKYGNICQAGINTDTAARELTHGFYIYYENVVDPEERKAEIEAISRMLADVGIDTSDAAEAPEKPEEKIVPAPGVVAPTTKYARPMRAKDPRACRQPYYGSTPDALDKFFMRRLELTNRQKRNYKEVKAEVHLRLSHAGQIRSAYVLSADKQLIDQIRVALAQMSLWHPAVLNGVAVKTTVRIKIAANEKGFVHVTGPLLLHRAFAKCGKQRDEDIFDYSAAESRSLTAPSVFNVDDRQIVKKASDRTAKLDSILLVVDLTGSMGPYIAQVLELMSDMVEKNDKRILSIALFNDGNGKPDKFKKVGSTGGIIVLKGDITLETLGKAVLQTMTKGNGGDCMENNLEAVLAGMDVCPGCNNVMMVADNFATPRDGELLSKITVPIHWILCGAALGINTSYLDLIRQNRGVLHTSGSVVDNLHTIAEDQVITIDGKRYQLKDGHFRAVEVR